MALQKTKPSFRSTFRGKHAIFASWLVTNPFVTSFVEDQHNGTAKETRNNTFLNRDVSLISLSSYQTDTDSSGSSSHSLDSISDLSSISKKNISFSTKVKVYSLDNPDNPVEEDVRESSNHPPLEVARKRKTSTPVVDVYQPTTAAGRWLVRKTSNLATLDPVTR